MSSTQSILVLEGHGVAFPFLRSWLRLFAPVVVAIPVVYGIEIPEADKLGEASPEEAAGDGFSVITTVTVFLDGGPQSELGVVVAASETILCRMD